MNRPIIILITKYLSKKQFVTAFGRNVRNYYYYYYYYYYYFSFTNNTVKPRANG